VASLERPQFTQWLTTCQWLAFSFVSNSNQEAAASGIEIHQINATKRKEAFVEAVLQKRAKH
jgi:hypothetical protein